MLVRIACDKSRSADSCMLVRIACGESRSADSCMLVRIAADSCRCPTLQCLAGRADRDRGRESGRRNAQAGRTPPAKPSHPVASALSKEPCNGFQRGFCKQPSCTRGHFCSRCDATDHGRATCPTVAAAIAASAGASARP
jgi:hypothetical protein